MILLPNLLNLIVYLFKDIGEFIECFIILPSHIFGSLFWFILSDTNPDSKYLILMGQLFGFFIYVPVFYLLITIIKKISEIIKKLLS